MEWNLGLKIGNKIEYKFTDSRVLVWQPNANIILNPIFLDIVNFIGDYYSLGSVLSYLAGCRDLTLGQFEIKQEIQDGRHRT